MNIGAIIFYKNINALTAKAQVLWWKFMYPLLPDRWRGYSHSSVYAGKSALGRELEAEANLQVDQTTFKLNWGKMDIYELLGKEEHSIKALNVALDMYEEELYGFISWLTTVIRGILHRLFPKKDVEHWNILWGWGKQCTEFVRDFLLAKCLFEIHDIPEPAVSRMHWIELRADLNWYNGNTFTPVDLGEIVRRHTKCFKKRSQYA